MEGEEKRGREKVRVGGWVDGKERRKEKQMEMSETKKKAKRTRNENKRGEKEVIFSLIKMHKREDELCSFSLSPLLSFAAFRLAARQPKLRAVMSLNCKCFFISDTHCLLIWQKHMLEGIR